MFISCLCCLDLHFLEVFFIFQPSKKKCCLSARPWRLGDLWLGLSDSAPGMSRDVLMGKRMGNRFLPPKHQGFPI